MTTQVIETLTQLITLKDGSIDVTRCDLMPETERAEVVNYLIRNNRPVLSRLVIGRTAFNELLRTHGYVKQFRLNNGQSYMGTLAHMKERWERSSMKAQVDGMRIAGTSHTLESIQSFAEAKGLQVIPSGGYNEVITLMASSGKAKAVYFLSSSIFKPLYNLLHTAL